MGFPTEPASTTLNAPAQNADSPPTPRRNFKLGSELNPEASSTNILAPQPTNAIGDLRAISFNIQTHHSINGAHTIMPDAELAAPRPPTPEPTNGPSQWTVDEATWICGYLSRTIPTSTGLIGNLPAMFAAKFSKTVNASELQLASDDFLEGYRSSGTRGPRMRSIENQQRWLFGVMADHHGDQREWTGDNGKQLSRQIFKDFGFLQRRKTKVVNLSDVEKTFAYTTLGDGVEVKSEGCVKPAPEPSKGRAYKSIELQWLLNYNNDGNKISHESDWGAIAIEFNAIFGRSRTAKTVLEAWESAAPRVEMLVPSVENLGGVPTRTRKLYIDAENAWLLENVPGLMEGIMGGLWATVKEAFDKVFPMGRSARSLGARWAYI